MSGGVVCVDLLGDVVPDDGDEVQFFLLLRGFFLLSLQGFKVFCKFFKVFSWMNR